MEDLPISSAISWRVTLRRTRKRVSHVSEEAMGLLESYPWPGNIRELEHAIERAVAMTNTSVLYPEDFPSEISRGGGASRQSCDLRCGSRRPVPPGRSRTWRRPHIIRVLQEVSFNKSKASEILGIDRATLYRKAQRYGIDLRGK